MSELRIEDGRGPRNARKKGREEGRSEGNSNR